jgi:hypothetical protein
MADYENKKTLSSNFIPHAKETVRKQLKYLTFNKYLQSYYATIINEMRHFVNYENI